LLSKKATDSRGRAVLTSYTYFGDGRTASTLTQIGDSFEDDELHLGKKKQVVSFYLPKGAYATVVLEALDL